MAKNGWKLSKVCSYYREYPAAFGQKREIVGVGPSDTRPTTLSAAIVFRYILFLAKKAPGIPVFGHCPKINYCSKNLKPQNFVLHDQVQFFTSSNSYYKYFPG